MNVWEAQIISAIYNKDSNTAIKLLKQGFPVNYSIKIRAESGVLQSGHSTLLLESISNSLEDLCEYLLEHGILVNSIDSQGRSPIHLAASLGDLDILQLLVRHNANTGIRDALGNTILHVSAMNKHRHIVSYIVEEIKFPVGVLNKLMQRPLDLCKSVQESSKSLAEIEELEVIIQYLWRKEEESKKNTKDKILKYSISPQVHSNQRTCRMKRQGIDSDTIQVSIFPFSKHITSISPFKGRQTIQNYLKEKHYAIQKENEGRIVSSTLSNYSMRSPSPALKLPGIKKNEITLKL